MEKFFEMSRLDLARLYLGIELIYFPEGILNCCSNIMLKQSWRGLVSDCYAVSIPMEEEVRIKAEMELKTTD
jgi:hypothetical protein